MRKLISVIIVVLVICAMSCISLASPTRSCSFTRGILTGTEKAVVNPNGSLIFTGSQIGVETAKGNKLVGAKTYTFPYDTLKSVTVSQSNVTAKYGYYAINVDSTDGSLRVYGYNY